MHDTTRLLINLWGIIIFTFIGPILLKAQSNDNCANATTLTVGSSCTSLQFDNISATAEDNVAADPSCGLYQGPDVWFSFVLPTSGALRIETENSAGSTPHSFTLYRGACNSFTEIQCVQLDHERTIYEPSLAGETLYLRVYSYNGAAGSAFDLCLYEPNIPQNDNCADAIELDSQDFCSIDLYTNGFATEQQAIAPDPSCGAYMGGDVWFKTLVPSSGYLRIETNNLISGTEKSVILYRGSCGNFTELFCSELDAEEIFYDPNWAGQIIFIRVFSYLSEEGGAFEMCSWEPTLPANDACNTAINVAPGQSCILGQFTNANATSEVFSTAPPPSCGAYMGGDVWFQTTVPSSGYLTVETNNLVNNTEKSVAVYTGTCGQFREVFCNELETIGTFFDPNWAGQTVYLRIYSYLTEEGGPFELCIWDDPCGTPDTAVEQSGLTLTASANNVSYQWIDCNANNTPISGATGKTFTASSAGNYAVRINEGGCAVTSECYQLVVVGLPESKIPQIKVYPNPVAQQLFIESDLADFTLELISLSGQRLQKQTYLRNSKVTLDVSAHPRGLYLLKLQTASQLIYTKVIKK